MNSVFILTDTVPLKITHLYKHTYIKQLCTFYCKVSRKKTLKAPLSGRLQFLSLESLLDLTLRRRQEEWRYSGNHASKVLLCWRRASLFCKSSLWEDGEKSTVSFVLTVIISEESPKGDLCRVACQRPRRLCALILCFLFLRLLLVKTLW